MRLRHKSGYSTIALAYVENTVAQAVRLIAEALVIRCVVENITRQVKIVYVKAVRNTLAFEFEFVRATHVWTVCMQDVGFFWKRWKESSV